MALVTGFPIDNHMRILYTQIIRLEPYTGSITQKERSYTLNHLAMVLILTVTAHLLWFAVMTERKYSLKKTLLLYGFYAVFFTIWSLLAFSLLGRDSPYVIPFSFIGTILPAFLLFLYTSSDTFCKKLFLIITYANLFCIFICISVLICDGLFLNLSTVWQMYARGIVRILLNLPALLVYFYFVRPYMHTVPGNKKQTWYSITLVSILFLIVFATLVDFLMHTGHPVEYLLLFITTLMIYCAVLWIVFGMIQHLNEEVKMELIRQNIQYLQGQLALTRDNESRAKAMRHDFRHHMQNINLLIKQEKPQEAIHYIENFIQSLDATKQTDFCQQVTVNAILNNFYNRAQKENLTFSVVADIPGNIAVADMDFVAILSNLLENAINGCLACNSHDKITVNLRVKKGKLIIVCSNPCRSDLVIENDLIMTKGTGIESILMAIDKYDGNICYQREDNSVTACIILNC